MLHHLINLLCITVPKKTHSLQRVMGQESTVQILPLHKHDIGQNLRYGEQNEQGKQTDL